MKKIFFLATIAFLLISVGGANAAVKVKDCKKDIKCLEKAAKTCQVSKAVISQKNQKDPMGISIQNIDYLYEIKGMKKGYCLFNTKTLKNTFHFTSSTIDFMKNNSTSTNIEADIAQMEAENVSDIAKIYNECKVKKPVQLYNTLKQWEKGNFSVDCKFTLSDAPAICTYSTGLVCEQKMKK